MAIMDYETGIKHTPQVSMSYELGQKSDNSFEKSDIPDNYKTCRQDVSDQGVRGKVESTGCSLQGEALTFSSTSQSKVCSTILSPIEVFDLISYWNEK